MQTTSIGQNHIISRMLMVLLIILICFISSVHPKKTDNVELKITALNVGQGDALLIQNQENNLGLVDGGKQDFILNELKNELGNRKDLEFIMATHPDADHIEGLLRVLDHYQVKYLFVTRKYFSDVLGLELIKNAVKNRVKVFELNDVNDFNFGCCINFNVLWPKKDTDLTTISDKNNTSIAVVISYKDFNLYMGGDLNSEYETKALESYKEHIDVLKVGHHGSKTSTPQSILNKFNFKTAIITSGANNSYGHPHKEVVDRLFASGVNVFNTAELGAITLTVRDRHSYEICSSVSGCKKYML